MKKKTTFTHKKKDKVMEETAFFNSNEKAVNLYKKCGFVQEAVLIKHIFKNGKYEDVAIYSLFNGD